MRRVVVATLMLVVVALVFVQSQQWLLRWRAERLLNDIRQIQMGKSTWVEAQRLMDRWGEWGHYEGSCTTERCSYQVVLQDVFRAHPTFYVSGDEVNQQTQERHFWRWLHKPYMMLGGRFTSVYARIEIKNGIIWTKSFDLSIDLFPNHPLQYVSEGDAFVATADGETRFDTHRMTLLGSHPEYMIEALGTCSGCRFIETSFTPFADSQIVQQLLDFNLNCITRWRECEEPGDIMPSAWRLYSQEKSAHQANNESRDTCNLPLEFAARDSWYVATAKVLKTRKTNEGRWSRQIVSLGPVTSMKKGKYNGPQIPLGEFVPFPPEYYSNQEDLGNLRPGDPLILLLGKGFDESDVVSHGPDRCGFFKYSQENLDAVQKGIGRDALSDRP